MTNVMKGFIRTVIVGLLLGFALVIFISFNEFNSARKGYADTALHFSLAVDSAASLSMQSEDVFSAIDSDNVFLSTSTLPVGELNYYYMSDAKLTAGKGGLYTLSKYFWDNGNSFPKVPTVSDLSRFELYSWLFTGTDADSVDDLNTLNVADFQNSTFYDFYSNVGSKLTYDTDILTQYQAGDDNAYTMFSNISVPLLQKMGLPFGYLVSGKSSEDGHAFDLCFNGCTDVNVVNTLLSNVVKGERNDDSSELSLDSDTDTSDNEVYYFTPYSLGVTYLPMKTLYPAVLLSLERECADAMNSRHLFISDVNNIKNKNAGDYISTDDMFSDEATSVITDGYVYYDLSTLRLNIKYYYIYPGVTDTTGTSAYDYIKQFMLGKSASANVTSFIAAKLTASIDVMYPYQSRIFRKYACKLSRIPSAQGGEYLCARDTDGSERRTYVYTTYISIAAPNGDVSGN